VVYGQEGNGGVDFLIRVRWGLLRAYHSGTMHCCMGIMAYCVSDLECMVCVLFSSTYCFFDDNDSA
jgi:hypothetical protein